MGNRTVYLREKNSSSLVQMNDSLQYVFSTTIASGAYYDPARFMIIFSNGASLPVHFRAFSAKSGEARTVALSWSTDSEVNSNHFLVERSANGVDFEPLICVKAAGHTASVMQYAATDANPLNGVNYYRLRAVDNDTSFTWSGGVVVNMADGRVSRTTVFPVLGHDQISVTCPEPPVRVVISEVTGKMVMPLGLTGSGTVTGSIGLLQDGVYFVTVLYADGRCGKKPGLSSNDMTASDSVPS